MVMADSTGLRAVGLGLAAVATVMALPQACSAAWEEHLDEGGPDPLVVVPGATMALADAGLSGNASREMPRGTGASAGAAAPAKAQPGAGRHAQARRQALDGSRGQRSRTTPGLHHSGPHPRVAGMRTVGEDVPFAYALRLVAPLGWGIDSTLADTGATASWRVGEPWSNVLHRAAKTAGATLYVDWKARRILVRPAGTDPLATARPDPGEKGENAAAAAVRGVGLQGRGEGVTTAGPARPRRAVRRGAARRQPVPPVLPSLQEPGCGFLTRSMTARELARALGLGVDDFCRLNCVGPESLLVRGRRVHLAQDVAPAPVPGSEDAGTPQAAPAPDAPQPSPATTAEGDAPAAAPGVAAGELPSPPKESAQESDAVPAALAAAAAAAPATAQAQADAAPVPLAPSVLQSKAGDRTLSAARATVPSGVATQAAEYTLVPGTFIAQLSRWCERAGYQLVWKADRDVEILSNVAYRGAFSRCLSLVFRDLAAAGQPFRATLYERNRVLEVNDN